MSSDALYWVAIVLSLGAIAYTMIGAWRARRLTREAERIAREARVILEQAYALAKGRNYP